MSKGIKPFAFPLEWHGVKIEFDGSHFSYEIEGKPFMSDSLYVARDAIDLNRTLKLVNEMKKMLEPTKELLNTFNEINDMVEIYGKRHKKVVNP